METTGGSYVVSIPVYEADGSAAALGIEKQNRNP